MQDGSATGQVALDSTLTMNQAEKVILGEATLHLEDAARMRCAAALARLQKVISEERHVYGITTGFGPLANRLVPAHSAQTLQQNLVHHLASGVGAPLSWAQARAMMLARLMSLVQGASGARIETIDLIIAVLNSEFAPVVPAKGSVGASGDLTPLAHMVLCLQGRGHFIDREATRREGPWVLERLGRAALDLSHRDGLALVNGTSAMTGIAVLNSRAMERAIQWALALTAVFSECLGGRSEAWHPAFAQLRPHPGQIRATDVLRQRVSGGAMETSLIAARRLEETSVTEDRAGQDAYTIRCAPQVIGAVWDTADWHRQVVEIELHSVTDNPIFPENAEAPALHGGNFMGTHVALSSDALGNAAAVLAGLAERQVARITDESLNLGLPAFLAGGEVGLNSGLMGAQVTATALLAEIRALGQASVQSISTNGANQDIVSQGTIAARLASERIEMLFCILAIAGAAVAQAMDLSKERRTFSPAAKSVHHFIREASPRVQEDRPLGLDIEDIAKIFSTNLPPH